MNRKSAGKRENLDTKALLRMTAKERSESTGMESGQQWREMTKEMERDVKGTVSEFPLRPKKVPWA